MSNNDSQVLRQIVLGAGASSGYPLGSDLLGIIAHILTFINKNFVEYQVSENFLPLSKSENVVNEGTKDLKDFLINVKNFAENLKKSCATSIDFFTTRIADKKMQIIAKSLIGGVLKQYKTDLNDTWYGDLLPLFFPEDVGFKKPEEKLEMIIELTKKIRIVTFNYDLSLEKFLYEFLKNNVFVSGEELQLESAKRVIFQTINHVYGSIDDPFNCDFDLIEEGGVGDLSKFHINYEKTDLERKYPGLIYKFNQDGLRNVLRDAFENQEVYNKNIKLMENERRTEIENSEYKLIKCPYLYVLGFGFDPINIERIGMKPEVWGGTNSLDEFGGGCYVTNFDDNKKIERLLLNNLTKKVFGYYHNREDHNYVVPIISKSKIADALKNDFSLMEIAKNYESISNNSNTSPLFALKKYQ
jgi:hypothetical protein